MKALAILSGIVLFLLAAIIAQQYGRSVAAARVTETSAKLWCLQTASTNYFSTFKQWPASIRDLTRNSSNIIFVDPDCTNDGWGRPIMLAPFDPKRGYGRILSYGRDGKPGGVGTDADIERRFGP